MHSSWFIFALLASFSAIAQTEESPIGTLLKLNPQLSKIPDWLKTIDTRRNDPIRDCDRCLNVQFPPGSTVYRCAFVSGKFGGEAWEKGGGDHGEFQLLLHPGTPKVWRVFTDGFASSETEKPALIAEFDLQGSMVWRRSARSKVLETGSSVRGIPPGWVPATECLPKGSTGRIMKGTDEPPPYRTGATNKAVTQPDAVPPTANPVGDAAKVGDAVKSAVGNLLKALGK